MNVKLIISDSDPHIVELLRSGLERCQEIAILQLKPDQLPSLDGLDAIYLSVMGAERWGARPIAHKAEVLRTTAGDAEKGLPPYVVAGGVFASDDPDDPAFQLQVVITSVVDAVKAFNVDHADAIRTVGFWADDLLVRDIDAFEAGKLIRSVYENSYRN